MGRKAVSGIMLPLLLISSLILVFNVEPVATGNTIYIRADGSVDPPTAPISTVDNVTYTFTDNINDSIVVERNDIVVDGAGYTVQGTGSGEGIDISNRGNITVENTTITSFENGVYLYYSHSNTLSGNNIVNNNEYGIYSSSSNNNIVTGNNVSNNRHSGISSGSSSGNILANNNLMLNDAFGIVIYYSSGNVIKNNNIKESKRGVYLYSSYTHEIIENTFINCGVIIEGYENPAYFHHIIENNTVNGKPIYYYKNTKDIIVPPNAGQVIVASCSNMVIKNTNVSFTSAGILLAFTSQSTIENNYATNMRARGVYLVHSTNNIVIKNNVLNNYRGIELDYASDNNNVTYNNVSNNNFVGITLYFASKNIVKNNNLNSNSLGICLQVLSSQNEIVNNDFRDRHGIYFDFSSSNLIYHNNFMCSVGQVSNGAGSTNLFDNYYPSGGNYWSDYTDVDLHSGPYQNETGSDGIWDHPYVIDENNQDHYPLVNPWTPTPPPLPIFHPPYARKSDGGTADRLGWPVVAESLYWSFADNVTGTGHLGIYADAYIGGTAWATAYFTLGDSWKSTSTGEYKFVALFNIDGFAETILYADRVKIVVGRGEVDLSLKASIQVVDRTEGGVVLQEELVIFPVKKWVGEPVYDPFPLKGEGREYSNTPYVIAGDLSLKQGHEYEWTFGIRMEGVASGVLTAGALARADIEVKLTEVRIQDPEIPVPSSGEGRVYNPKIELFKQGAVDFYRTLYEKGKRILHFKCPVNVTIVDEYGRVISETKNQIPGAIFVYHNRTDMKIFYLPLNLTYNVHVFGTDYGNATIIEMIPTESIYETAFSQVTFNLTSETVAEFDLLPYDANYTLKVDEDGDGSIDYEHIPVVVIMTTEYDVGITEIVPSKTLVGQGYSLPINITVLNYGAYTETFNVTLYANDTFIELQTITLASGNSTTLTFTWNTTGVAKGNYTITAKATQLPDETDTTDNTYIDGWIIVTILGDVNGDFEVDVFDKVIVGAAFGATYNAIDGMYWHQPPDFPGPCIYCPHTPNADINGDGIIDVFDKVIVGYHFGETKP